MNIQSFSLSIPGGCPNNCKFCVSHMHHGNYTNQLDCNSLFFDLYLEDFEQKLMFVRDNGCNSCLITSSGEALTNRQYLMIFGMINKKMEKPFRNIELQTSGVLLEENYLRFLRNHVWIKTISLSVSDLFDDENNFNIMQTPEKLRYNLKELCVLIKKYDFNLRLSFNVSSAYSTYQYRTSEDRARTIIKRAKQLGADQLTIRKLYTSGNDTFEDQWILNNSVEDSYFEEFNKYVKKNGTPIRKLIFGATVYMCEGLSIVIDEDCMATNIIDTSVKYLILREDMHLYSHWNDPGSLVF